MRKRRSRQPAMLGISGLYLVYQWLQSFPARPFIGRQAGFWGDWTQECPWDGQERSGLQERLQREASPQQVTPGFLLQPLYIPRRTAAPRNTGAGSCHQQESCTGSNE